LSADFAAYVLGRFETNAVGARRARRTSRAITARGTRQTLRAFRSDGTDLTFSTSTTGNGKSHYQ
jgi:hypothetical protein